jgi:hypothetical protein
MQELETVSLLIPQITAEMFAQTWGGKGTFRQSGTPVLLTIESLVSNWRMANDDSEKGIRFAR